MGHPTTILFIADSSNSTLTRNIFNALRDQIDPTIPAISTLMIVVTSLLLALAQVYGRRRTDRPDDLSLCNCADD